MKVLSRISFLCFIYIYLIHGTSSEEASCRIDDGDCDGEQTDHNVWTEEEEKPKKKFIVADESILLTFKENGISLSRVELALLLHHLDEDGDGRVDGDELKSSIKLIQSNNPLNIVLSVINSFNALDSNNDGQLNKDELPSTTSSSSSPKNEEDVEIEEVSIGEYLPIISKLAKEVAQALIPFKGLGFLSPLEFKTVLAKSVSVFLEKDVDSSGGLNMDEYLSQIDRPEHPRSQLLDATQKEQIFGMIDKDGDGEISYAEFQGVIPKGPPSPPTLPSLKDIEKIFDNADKDGDGYWSKDEFTLHLQGMMAKGGGGDRPEPSEGEISEAFRSLDVDEDGHVSREEMGGIQQQIIKIQEEKAAKGFQEMDLNGDGVLTKDEMSGMAEAMEERSGGQKVDVDALIGMMDKNGNGVIELEEVTEMVHRMTTQPQQPQQQQ